MAQWLLALRCSGLHTQNGTLVLLPVCKYLLTVGGQGEARPAEACPLCGAEGTQGL